MAQITVRNIPSDVHTSLKKRARRNQRSLSQEVACILERAAETDEAERQAVIDRVVRRREQQPEAPIGPEELKHMQREDAA